MALYTRLIRRRPRSVTKRWHLVFGTIASVGLAWAAVNGLVWDNVWDTLQHFQTGVVLLGIIPMLASMTLRAARWHVLLHDQQVSGWQTFMAQNTGIGVNNLSPIRMISEPVQLVIIIRHYGVAAPTAMATLVAGNVLDIFATGILMGFGVIISPDLRGLNVQLAGAFILFIVSVMVLIIVAKGLGVIPIANRMRYFQQMVVALSLLRKQPKRLALSFGFTWLHWVLLGFAGWIIARSIGLDLNLVVITALLVGTTFFVSAVPSLPGGVGSYELAMTHTLRILGVDHATAFAFAVIMHLVVFLPPTTIAIVMLLRLGVSRIIKQSQQGVSNEEEKDQFGMNPPPASRRGPSPQA